MLEVLFSDAYFLAVVKPGGVPSQRDHSNDPCVIDLAGDGGEGGLGLPHRLDRPVSGVMLLSRTPESLSRLSGLFAEGGVEKCYWAIVEGEPGEAGDWEHRLVHDARTQKARLANDGSGKVARLHVERLAQGDRFALVALHPERGLFHQLRAQCAAAGHPIKGDVKYGARRGEADRTIFLHARSLAFEHPFTKARIRIDAPVPAKPLWKAFSDMMGPS